MPTITTWPPPCSGSLENASIATHAIRLTPVSTPSVSTTARTTSADPRRENPRSTASVV